MFLMSEVPLQLLSTTCRVCPTLAVTGPDRTWPDVKMFRWLPATASVRYRGTSLMRKCTPLGPYRRHMPIPRGVLGGWAFSYGRP